MQHERKAGEAFLDFRQPIQVKALGASKFVCAMAGADGNRKAVTAGFLLQIPALCWNQSGWPL